MLELWELGGRRDCRFSTFSWRTRLALHHKGLAFVLHPVAVSDKAAIAFSGQSKVPILKHDDHVVTNSWAIACYLERAFPDAPSLFGGPVGESLTHFFNLWADGELVPAIVPYLMRDVLDCVEEADERHLRSQIEAFFKKSLEQLAGERGKALEQVGRRLQPVRKALEHAVSSAAMRRPMPIISCSASSNGPASSPPRRCSRRMTWCRPGLRACSISMTASGARNCRAPFACRRPRHEDRHHRRRTGRALFRDPDEEGRSAPTT